MYQGSDPTLQDLQAQITALTGRVNTIDGQGLADPTEGVLAQLTRKYAGLKSDLKQSVMLLESILNTTKATVTEYLTLVKQHLGL